MSDERAVVINNSVIIKTVFEEMLAALSDDFDPIWDGVFANLFNLDGRNDMAEDDTILIDDGSGNSKELVKEEIEDLIVRKVMAMEMILHKLFYQ